MAAALRRVGASAPRRVPSDSLLILTFHRVMPEELRSQYPLPGLAVTPEELSWVLEKLAPNFDVLPVGEAWVHLTSRTKREHDRPLLSISFDDGQWDNLEFAAPVLREHGVRATFYVPVDAIEKNEMLWHDRVAFAWSSAELSSTLRESWLRSAGLTGLMIDSQTIDVLEALKSLPTLTRLKVVDDMLHCAPSGPPEWARMMKWDEVAQLSQCAHEIGSHGMSHQLLAQLSSQDQARELDDSRRAIEHRIGVKVRSICYPNGSYGERTPQLAAEAGYICGVTTDWGINKPASSALALRRCDIDARRLVDRHGKLSEARLLSRLFIKGAVRSLPRP